MDCAGVGFGAEDVGGVEGAVVGQGFVEGGHEGVGGAYTRGVRGTIGLEEVPVKRPPQSLVVAAII